MLLRLNNNSMTTPNPHAAALAKLGKGIKKTMSAKAIAQRKAAAKKPRKKKTNERQP